MVIHALRQLKKIGVSKIICNTHHLAKLTRKELKALSYELDLQIKFSNEDQVILDSGGGIAKAGAMVDGDSFFVLNGDSFFFEILKSSSERDFNYGSSLRQLWQAHSVKKPAITLLVTPALGAGQAFSGVWHTQDGIVKGFGKLPEFIKNYGSHNQLSVSHYVGAMVVEKRVLRKLRKSPESLFHNAFRDGRLRNEIRVFSMALEWAELGSIEEIRGAHHRYSFKEMKPFMFNGRSVYPYNFLD